MVLGPLGHEKKWQSLDTFHKSGFPEMPELNFLRQMAAAVLTFDLLDSAVSPTSDAGPVTVVPFQRAWASKESPNMALLASSTMEHNNCRSHQPVEASFPKSMRITRETEKKKHNISGSWFSPQNRAWISQIPHQLLDSFGFLQTSISTWTCQWMGIIFSNSTSRRSDCQVMSSWR